MTEKEKAKATNNFQRHMLVMNSLSAILADGESEDVKIIKESVDYTIKLMKKIDSSPILLIETYGCRVGEGGAGRSPEMAEPARDKA